MRLFWMKNKVLIATLLAVLVLGVAFWGGLRLFEGNERRTVPPPRPSPRLCPQSWCPRTF